MRSDLPAGTVTFLFTDVEGSTKLLHSLGAEAYADSLAEHRAIIRAACTEHGGVEVDTQGDAFFFAFATAPGALAAADAFTRTLASTEIHVRVGIHTGTALLAAEGYVGDDVHVAARVGGAAHGGQVVVSSVTAELVEDHLVSLGTHRLKDIAEPVSLFQLGASSFPPLKTIANTNLPTPASSFLGREAELVEVDQLLQSTRLLTIHGPGGQGKTRFAIELATRAREERFGDYRDGVFSCFLASLRDPALVLPTIAQTLSVKEQPGQSALEALATHLQGKRLLLLLDNLEHLLEAAAELSQLLQACPSLTLLVTSRERLRIQGEEAYALPPLPESEGIALFCERAKAEPSPTIAQIATRLEGLPLAIELAAARTAILTPAQLLERLSSRLDLLKGGRDADPRQQTLRATIEWSYDLLQDDEQRLFRALSVFQGGCTLEAAEEVADADLDTLQSLVDKSLLRFTQERFWMLETLREFAGERLARAGEKDSVSGRLAGVVLTLAAEIESTSGSDVATRAFSVDQANVRSALAWAETNGQGEVLLCVIARAWPFWWYRGHASEGSRLVASALRACVGDRHLLRAKVLAGAAMFAVRGGDYEAARGYAGESLDIARELCDEAATVWPLILLGLCAMDTGDLEQAARLTDLAVDAARRVEDRYLVGVGLNNLGNLALIRQDHEGGARLFQEALTISLELGTSDIAATEMVNLAWCLHLGGRVDDAIAMAREGLVLARELDNFRSISDGLVLAGAIACRQGRAEAGARLVGAAGSLSARFGDVPAEDGTLTPTIEELVRALGEGAYAFALDEGAAMSLDEAMAYADAFLERFNSFAREREVTGDE